MKSKHGKNNSHSGTYLSKFGKLCITNLSMSLFQWHLLIDILWKRCGENEILTYSDPLVAALKPDTRCIFFTCCSDQTSDQMMSLWGRPTVTFDITNLCPWRTWMAVDLFTVKFNDTFSQPKSFLLVISTYQYIREVVSLYWDMSVITVIILNGRDVSLISFS